MEPEELQRASSLTLDRLQLARRVVDDTDSLKHVRFVAADVGGPLAYSYLLSRPGQPPAGFNLTHLTAIDGRSLIMGFPLAGILQVLAGCPTDFTSFSVDSPTVHPVDWTENDDPCEEVAYARRAFDPSADVAVVRLVPPTRPNATWFARVLVNETEMGGMIPATAPGLAALQQVAGGAVLFLV